MNITKGFAIYLREDKVDTRRKNNVDSYLRCKEKEVQGKVKQVAGEVSKWQEQCESTNLRWRGRDSHRQGK